MTSHAAAREARRAAARTHPVAVTANRLADGAVIYLGAHGGWTEHLGAARVIAPEEDLDPFLETARGAAEARLLLDPYPLPVRVEGGRVGALSVRERIRAAGPTVRPDLGREAVPHVPL